jgi:hypothetical protein
MRRAPSCGVRSPRIRDRQFAEDAQRMLRRQPRGVGLHGFAVGMELSLPTTIADFPCCAIFRACRHHYPGGIVGRVSRSLHRRRSAPTLVLSSPAQCSLTLRPARSADPTGPFYRSASDLRRLLIRSDRFRRISIWENDAPRQGTRSNRAENSHLRVRRRERKMQRFKLLGSAHRTLMCVHTLRL